MLVSLVFSLLLTQENSITLTNGSQYSIKDSQYTVVIFLSHDCPIANDMQPDVERIYQKYRLKNVTFIGMYIDPRVTKNITEKHKQDYRFKYDQSIDKSHIWVKRLNARVTPEAHILNSFGEVLYQGRINDMYNKVGSRKKSVTEQTLDLALDSLLNGKEVKEPRTEAFGCVIPNLSDFDEV